MTSGGSVVPIGAVFGLEEDTGSLKELISLFRQQCVIKGVHCPAFQLRDVSISSEDIPIFDEDVHKWATSNLRNYIFPPEWEVFLVKFMRDNASDEELMACIPQHNSEPTLHCDSGPAFIALTKDICWTRTACAKHLEPNISSCKYELKDQAMNLIYGKHISVNIAFEIRDKLLSDVLSCGALSKPTKDWFMKTFGSDAAMKVSVHCIIY